MSSLNISSPCFARRSTLAVALRLVLCGATIAPCSVLAQTVVITEGQSVEVPGTYPSPWNIPADGQTYNEDLLVRGNLLIRNGGVVNSAHTNIKATPPNAPAMVTVSGMGSTLNSSVLGVGDHTTGTPRDHASLLVERGGVVNSSQTGIALGGNQAEVIVRGANSVFNAGSLSVGNMDAQATLNVLDGGRLNSSGLAQVGYSFDGRTGHFRSSSTVMIDGNGSRWNSGGDVDVVLGSQVVVANDGVLVAPKVRMKSGLVDSSNWGQPQTAGALVIGGPLILGDGYSPSPAAPVGAGQILADQINIDFGYLVFNHTASDYRFNSRLVVDPSVLNLMGTREIRVYAGTTHLTADSGSFQGQATVFGGKLLVDGVLSGKATVNGGGIFGGAGRFDGNVTVNSGGKLAPGNSIGTLTIGGDLTFAAGSIYEVEVDPQGTSDQVAVAGKAVINGGSVISVGQDSGFKPFTQYTILTAGGGVSGQFASASNNYAFLNPSLVYEPNAVKLQLLRNDVSFGSIAVTTNQRAAAMGAESTGPGNPVWNAVAVLSAEQARTALDSVSGELHASTQTAFIEDALSIQHAVLDGYADTDQRGDTRVWLKALGARAQIDKTRETAKLERNSSGLLIGADFALGEDWRLGALLGAGKTRNDVDALGSRSESDNLHVGVYADAAWENGWRLRLGGIRSNYDLDTRRRVTVAGLGGEFTAGTDARATQFYGELGYAFDAGAVELEPFLAVSRVKLKTDGFGEQGGAGALQGENVDASTRYATLGLRLGYGFGDSSRWRLGGSLAWRRASGDLEPVSKLRFDGGQSFLIEGAPIARDAAAVTAGVTARLSERASLDVSYLGQVASDADDHGAAANLTIHF